MWTKAAVLDPPIDHFMLSNSPISALARQPLCPAPGLERDMDWLFARVRNVPAQLAYVVYTALALILRVVQKV